MSAYGWLTDMPLVPLQWGDIVRIREPDLLRWDRAVVVGHTPWGMLVVRRPVTEVVTSASADTHLDLTHPCGWARAMHLTSTIPIPANDWGERWVQLRVSRAVIGLAQGRASDVAPGWEVSDAELRVMVRALRLAALTDLRTLDGRKW